MHIKNVCYRVILELEIAYKNCSIKLKKKISLSDLNVQNVI